MTNHQKIIFPSQSSKIISKLMKKWGIDETVEESLEKFAQGEVPIGAKLATIIQKSVQEKISFQKLALILQKKLTLPLNKANGLAKDIEKEVFVLVNQSSKKTEKIKEQEIIEKTKKESQEKTLISKDDYRELIE